MKCPDEIIEIMHEFLDEELDKRKEKRLRDHLRSCRDCQTIFDEFKKTIAF